MEDDTERYNFTWNGKGRALRLSQIPSMGALRPCKEESIGWDRTENLYIEGDNLEVLKLLQKSYYEKVKMIYIDPPYNTNGDFVYPDSYTDSIREYKLIERCCKELKRQLSVSSAKIIYTKAKININQGGLETKGNILPEALRPMERKKIECGHKHFETLAADVHFEETDSFVEWIEQDKITKARIAEI